MIREMAAVKQPRWSEQHSGEEALGPSPRVGLAVFGWVAVNPRRPSAVSVRVSVASGLRAASCEGDMFRGGSVVSVP